MKNLKIILLIFSAVFITACGNQKNSSNTNTNSTATNVYPFSDQENKGNWKLRTDVSDEFEDDKIDEEKWYIVGKFKDGKPFYKHPDFPNKKVWKGRQPSQFSGRNYRLEDGKLILETRWEPNFPFSDELSKPWGKQKTRSKYENLTTACFIGRKFFKYGYMEIKSKAADAEITSAFWGIGGKTELDIFEQFGDHRQPVKEKNGKDRELWWSIHDWSREGKGRTVYTEHLDYGFRVADDFHIYGIEWNENGLKLYVDGKYKTGATKEQVEAYAKKRNLPNGWVLVNPISIWLDQETFPWHGVPDSKEDLELNSPEGKKEDGVVDFEIEYVRIWQKKQ